MTNGTWRLDIQQWSASFPLMIFCGSLIAPRPSKRACCLANVDIIARAESQCTVLIQCIYLDYMSGCGLCLVPPSPYHQIHSPPTSTDTSIVSQIKLLSILIVDCSEVSLS